jgi:NADPH-dependent curcumin reductase CurA
MNRQWKLAARPVGLPKRSDFQLVTAEVPEPADGEVLVRVELLSLDPAMRGWMNEGRSYVPPVALGEVMRAGGLGRVEKSKDPSLAPGDIVTGITGVQEWVSVKAKQLQKIDPSLAPKPRWLSVLGMPGMTAYFGLLEIGKPKAGDTVLISGAAGAVGAVAGQIAKIKGCRVVGIAGGMQKCAYLRELGFDAAIDYEHENIRAALHQHCPKGIDVYFDNVGGEILDEALARLALHARVVICGAISQYNSQEGFRGPKNYMSLLVNRARMEGFVVFDFAARYGEAIRDIAKWLQEETLVSREDVVRGLDTFPDTLNMLYRGENFGKLILQVA